MGNSLKLGCRPLNLRDVIVPERVSRSSSPSLAEVDKVKLQAFRIEDECQLDDLLGEIEQVRDAVLFIITSPKMSFC